MIKDNRVGSKIYKYPVALYIIYNCPLVASLIEKLQLLGHWIFGIEAYYEIVIQEYQKCRPEFGKTLRRL